MKRLFILLFLFLVLLLALTAVWNAPRLAEARAHEAAARALQTQAAVNGLAVAGVLLLALLLAAVSLAFAALILWAAATGRLSSPGSSHHTRRLPPHDAHYPTDGRLPSTTTTSHLTQHPPYPTIWQPPSLDEDAWETTLWDIDDPF